MKELRSIVKSAHWVAYTSLFWLSIYNNGIPSPANEIQLGWLFFIIWTIVLVVFGIFYCTSHWDDK